MPDPDSAVAAPVAQMEQFIAATDLLAGVRHLLVACSGGGDSIALLELLAEPRRATRLSVVHCNHQARPDAQRDSDFVAAAAAARGLPFHLLTLPVAADERGSREARWREDRYAALAELAARVEADAVATGHTADDQAETVLLNIARGAGVRGLAAMRARTRLNGLVVLRPLLSCRRHDLRAYLKARGRTWCSDVSNTDVRFSRNRVRARVLPELEAMAPGATENIARAAALLREHDDFINELALEHFANLRREDDFPGAIALEIGGLNALGRPLRAAVLRRAFRAVRGNLHRISKQHVDLVIDGVMRSDPKAADLPGLRVRNQGTVLRVLPLSGRNLPAVDSQRAS